MNKDEQFRHAVSRIVAEHLLDVAACNAFNLGMSADEIVTVVRDAVSSDMPDDRKAGGLSVIMPKCCCPKDDEREDPNGGKSDAC